MIVKVKSLVNEIKSFIIFIKIYLFGLKLNLSVKKESLFITSEKGLFLFNGYTKKILGIYCFGITASDKELFLALSFYNHSVVVGLTYKVMSKCLRFSKLKIYYLQKIYDHGQRIHQIQYKKNNLFITNTAKNSIVIVNVVNRTTTETFPFVDSTGHPIRTHHNHINSILCLNDCIVFTAHNGGTKSSIIGILNNEKSELYSYKNKGIHDIIIIDKNKLTFSDSFGSVKYSSKHGYKGIGSDVIVNGECILRKNCMQDYFFIRGLYSNNSKLIVGSSFHGKRDKRFSGNASLIEFKDFIYKKKVEMPFSQFYDVISLTNQKSDMLFYSDLKKLLSASFVTYVCSNKIHIFDDEFRDFKHINISSYL